MRLFSKGGVPPCDRRLDRGKVAIAALAALFMFATSAAKADIVDFDIDYSKSYLYSHTLWDIGKLVGGDATPYLTAGLQIKSAPQVADVDGIGPKTYGSDKNHLDGTLLVDLTSTTIHFPGGSTINYEVTGDYAPFDPIYSDPAHPTAGLTKGANFGTKITIGSPLGTISTVQHMLKGDMINLGAPAIPLAGGPVQTFPMFFDYKNALTNPAGTDTGVALLYTEGQLAFSNTGTTKVVDEETLVGDPISLQSTQAMFGLVSAAYAAAYILPVGTPDVGSYDTGTLTLTIPVHSATLLGINMDTDTTIEILIFAMTTGVIVATPRVPEPSTMVMLGFGIVGLMSCAWRVRKRRA